MDAREPRPSPARMILLLALLVATVAGNFLAGAGAELLGLGITMFAAAGFVYQVISGAMLSAR